MIAKFALYKIFGLPLVAYGGILTLFLFSIVGLLGYLLAQGKIKISLKWHFNLARIALVMGFLHGILGLSIFLNF